MRLVILIEHGDIKSGITSLVFVELSQADFDYVVDGAVYLLPAERLYRGDTPMPGSRPAGKHQLIIG